MTRIKDISCYLLKAKKLLNDKILHLTLRCSTSSASITTQKNRSPISKSNSAEAQETADFFFASSDLRAGKTFPQTKIFGLHGKSDSGENAQNDGCSSENVVPEQKDKMEVRNPVLTFSLLKKGLPSCKMP